MSSFVVRLRLRRPAHRLRAMSSQGRDGLFRKALKALPVQLREALVEAELDDPVVLRSFPSASLSRQGVHEGGRRSATYAQVWQTGDDTSGRTTLGTTSMDNITIGIATTLDGTVGTIGGATSGIGSIGGATMGTEAIDGTVTIGGATMGTVAIGGASASAPFPGAGKRARGKRAKSAVPSAECANFPMVERVETESGFSGNWRVGKVQNFPASLISSELSAHQMAPECSSASALEPMGASSSADPLPRVPDSLLLYWTLVDQSVVPPGFEEAFACFSVQWSEAAARDDSRKSHWNNETAALSLAAQRKAQEESERLERHSKDQFLLAAIQPPSTYRTKFQKIA